MGTPSGIIGVARDGFPLYGPMGDDGVQLTADDLDDCQGRFHLITSGEHAGKYTYRYHLTEEFPYTMGCYRGDTSIIKGNLGGQGSCTPDIAQKPCYNINCNCYTTPDECDGCDARRRRSALPYSLESTDERMARMQQESRQFHRRQKRGVTMQCDGRE